METYSPRQVYKQFSKWHDNVMKVNKLLCVYNHCLGSYEIFIHGHEEISSYEAKLMLCASSFQKYNYKLPKELPKVHSVNYNNLRLALEAMVIAEVTEDDYVDNEYAFNYLMNNTQISSVGQLYKSDKYLNYTKTIEGMDYRVLPTGNVYSGNLTAQGDTFFDMRPKFITFTDDVYLPDVGSDIDPFVLMPQMFVNNNMSTKAIGNTLILGVGAGYTSYLAGISKPVKSLTIIDEWEDLVYNFEQNYLPGISKTIREQSKIYKDHVLTYLSNISPHNFDSILLPESISLEEYLQILTVMELTGIPADKVHIYYEDACLWELFSYMVTGFITNKTTPFVSVPDDKQQLARLLCRNTTDIQRLSNIAYFKQMIIKNLDAILKIKGIELNLKG